MSGATPRRPARGPEWFEEWFQEDYLALYPHRDAADAGRLVALLTRLVPWQDGMRVLDVACGPGRHARAFTTAGARCTGVDLSMTLLRTAKRAGVGSLVRADMRALPIRPRSMDLAVNLFTSFGYFERDDEHVAALRGMVGTVRRGGWFAIDFLNAAAVRAALVPRETVRAAGGTPLDVERRLIDGGRYVCKTVRAADGRNWMERVRLFEAAELAELLAGTGVDVRHRLGDYDGGGLDHASPRVILVGEVA